jgi:hypothetical protein
LNVRAVITSEGVTGGAERHQRQHPDQPASRPGPHHSQILRLDDVLVFNTPSSTHSLIRVLERE